MILLPWEYFIRNSFDDYEAYVVYFSKVLWPDFDEKELILAINDFNARERRYGIIQKRI